MEESFEKKLKEYSADLLLLLAISAELHILLEDEGLQIRHGVTLLAESGEDFESILDCLQKMGAKSCRNLERKTWNIANNMLAVHPYGLYEKNEQIEDFLEVESFTPVILVRGFVPENLQTSNLLVLVGTDEKDDERTNIIKKARENPSEAQQAIRLFKTSEAYLQKRHKHTFFVTLETAAYIFFILYRKDHYEQETDEQYKKLLEAVRYAESEGEKYCGEYDMATCVRKAIEDYLDRADDIRICNVNAVEGDEQMAVEDRQAVLYDEQFYYFPEELLRSACDSLSDVVSLPKIKEELCKKGYLWCNDSRTRNFTVKRQFTNVFGATSRGRFLKIAKKFFENIDSLGLEERRGEEGCISGAFATCPAR